MAVWAEQVQELITTRQSDEVWRVLRRSAREDPVAARELGHLMLQVSWVDTQPTVPGDTPEAEHWLRHAVSARPDDVQAIILLATLLSVQCDQIWDMTFRSRRRKRWDSDSKRRAEDAYRLYDAALLLDPLSGAAASGLAWLLSKHGSFMNVGEPSAVAIARRALAINGDEPVAMLVLAEESGDNGLRERALAISPESSRVRSQVTSVARSVPPGQPGQFDYFVLEVKLVVTNNGETVPRLVVLRDVDQVCRFDACGWNITEALAHQYQGGFLVAKHRKSRLSGKSLGQVVSDWQTSRTPALGGRPLPVGHPVRHKGETLSYGINGALTPG